MHVFLVTVPPDSSVDTEKIEVEYPDSMKLWDHNWLVATNQTVEQLANALTIGTKPESVGLVVNLHLVGRRTSIHGFLNAAALDQMSKWSNK